MVLLLSNLYMMLTISSFVRVARRCAFLAILFGAIIHALGFTWSFAKQRQPLGTNLTFLFLPVYGSWRAKNLLFATCFMASFVAPISVWRLCWIISVKKWSGLVILRLPFLTCGVRGGFEFLWVPCLFMGLLMLAGVPCAE